MAAINSYLQSEEESILEGTSLYRKSASIIALHWLLNFLFTYLNQIKAQEKHTLKHIQYRIPSFSVSLGCLLVLGGSGREDGNMISLRSYLT
jgi:hypothetical protein